MILGDLTEKTVNFSNGVSNEGSDDPYTSTPMDESKFAEFTVNGTTPDKVFNSEEKWIWKITEITWNGNTITVAPLEVEVTSGHKVYTVFGEPEGPWSTAPGGGSNPWTGNQDNPWSEALQYTCSWAKGATTVDAVASAVTKNVYQANLKYDTKKGESSYSSSGAFLLTEFISQALEGSNDHETNCFDCAMAVKTFANIAGTEMKSYSVGPFGYINAVDPIGRKDDYTNNPFHGDTVNYRDDAIVFQDGTGGTCNRSDFYQHAFAGLGGKVYDATMKGNAENNKDTTIKFPSPPKGNQQSSDLSATVLTDDDENWTQDEWIGYKLNPNANDITPDPYETYKIVDNTGSTITVQAGNDMTTDAGAGDYYEIFDPNNPVFSEKWFIGIPWPDYKPKAIDLGQSGTPGTPRSFSFSIQ